MDVPDRTPPPTVAVHDVDVRYRVASTETTRAPGTHRLANVARAVVGRGPQVVVHALRRISFVARSGEQIGILGQNGSGKTTLLRVIAGLEQPARGQVQAECQPVLIGVNAALVPHLSGEQNARLGCLAMGLNPEETARAVPDVVRLAGLGTSIHLPMKTYSSGMASRLRFAIATAADPEILLVDEALATGDAAFKERSENRMAQLRANAGTVFLVSHAARTVEETCTRAIWLDHGRVVLDGPAVDVALRYRRWSWAVAQDKPREASALLEAAVDAHEPTSVRFEDEPRRSRTPRHSRGLRPRRRGATRESR